MHLLAIRLHSNQLRVFFVAAKPQDITFKSAPFTYGEFWLEYPLSLYLTLVSLLLIL